MNRLILATAFLFGALASASAWILWPDKYEQRTAPELMDVVMWNKEPVGGPFTIQTLTLVEKRADGSVRGKSLMPVRFVPMLGAVEKSN